jgi:hypothetical protein
VKKPVLTPRVNYETEGQSAAGLGGAWIGFWQCLNPTLVHFSGSAIWVGVEGGVLDPAAFLAVPLGRRTI